MAGRPGQTPGDRSLAQPAFRTRRDVHAVAQRMPPGRSETRSSLIAAAVATSGTEPGLWDTDAPRGGGSRGACPFSIANLAPIDEFSNQFGATVRPVPNASEPTPNPRLPPSTSGRAGRRMRVGTRAVRGIRGSLRFVAGPCPRGPTGEAAPRGRARGGQSNLCESPETCAFRLLWGRPDPPRQGPARAFQINGIQMNGKDWKGPTRTHPPPRGSSPAPGGGATRPAGPRAGRRSRSSATPWTRHGGTARRSRTAIGWPTCSTGP
jgi:hypothetical protein